MPAYGFERIIDPPQFEVNTLRLLSEFHAGSLTLAETWRSMLAPATVGTVLEAPAEAGRLGDQARARLGIGGDVGVHERPAPPRWPRIGAFLLPSCGAASSTTSSSPPAIPKPSLESLVAALVPIYFGRVGSFVIENRNVTTDQAEERVERQARESLLKPYLVKRWRAAEAELGGRAG